MSYMEHTTRLSKTDRDLLRDLAAILNVSVAELTRQIIHDGIKRLLDPAEINRQIEGERQRWHAAAALVADEVQR